MGSSEWVRSAWLLAGCLCFGFARALDSMPVSIDFWQRNARGVLAGVFWTFFVVGIAKWVEAWKE